MTLKEELDQLDQQIAVLNSRRAEIYKKSLDAPEVDKVCPDFLAGMLAGPEEESPRPRQEVRFTRLAWGEFEVLKGHRGPDPHWVAVRPCSGDGEKTYLGILIGDFALGLSARIDSETGILSVCASMHNPAMYVPDLGRVVFGCESWWRSVKKPEDLQAITDADIQNVWYVRALQDLGRAAQPATCSSPAQT